MLPLRSPRRCAPGLCTLGAIPDQVHTTPAICYRTSFGIGHYGSYTAAESLDQAGTHDRRCVDPKAPHPITQRYTSCLTADRMASTRPTESRETPATNCASKHSAAIYGGVLMNRWVTLILWFLLAVPSFGAGKKWTQAENMGFAGPIKAASTACQTFMQQPAQPDGQAIIYQHTCGE